MLVLSRMVGEEVVIGRDIIVRVSKVTRSRVCLAIEAPANVGIDRNEIHLSKRKERRLTVHCGARNRVPQTDVPPAGQSAQPTLRDAVNRLIVTIKSNGGPMIPTFRVSRRSNSAFFSGCVIV